MYFREAQNGHYPFAQAFFILFVVCLLQGLSLAAIAAVTAEHSENSLPVQSQILKRATEIKIDNEGLATQTSYQEILIGDDDAIQDYSQLEIPYNPFHEQINLNFARVRHPDGSVYDVKPDAIQHQNRPNENFYLNDKILVFSPPALRTGSVIEMEYTKQEISAVIPGEYTHAHSFYWAESQAGNGERRLDPVAESIIRIQLPPAMDMKYALSEMIDAEFKSTQDTQGKVLEFRATNLPGIPNETGIPDHLNNYPLLLLSSLQNWKQVNVWSRSLLAPRIETSDAVRRIAERIKAEHSNEYDRIRAVHAYIQDNVRYVFAHLGRNGYEPHSAQEVLENGYGDCKDQTVLALSLFRLLDIEAYAALTSAYNGLALSLPRPYFDHMIVFLPATDSRESIWFDTSTDGLDFPGLHWSNKGQAALVIDGVSNTLLTTEAMAIEDNISRVDLNFRYLNDFDVAVDMDFEFQGAVGQNIRAALMYSPDPQSFVRDTALQFYPTATVLSVGHSLPEDNNDAVTIAASLKLKDVWTGIPDPVLYAANVTQYLNLVSDFGSLIAPEERHFPFHFGVPNTLELKVEFPSPDSGYVPITLSQGDDYSSPYLSVTQEKHTPENGSSGFIARFKQHAFVTPDKKAYKAYYEAAEAIRKLPAWTVSFQYDELGAKISRLESNTSGESLEQLINLAQAYLDNGEFEKAFEASNKALALDAGSADAHYLMGIALGYQQKFEASNQAFMRAMELGHEL